jgi:hypothetical protein
MLALSRPKDGVLSHAYVAAIHVLTDFAISKAWMAGTSPAMTSNEFGSHSFKTTRSLKTCAFLIRSDEAEKQITVQNNFF